jgi:hypothetical protein
MVIRAWIMLAIPTLNLNEPRGGLAQETLVVAVSEYQDLGGHMVAQLCLTVMVSSSSATSSHASRVSSN